MKYAARFLVVVLLLSLFTPCLQAEDALPFTYEIKNNEVILTSYTGPDSGTVVIPDEIEGLPVTAFGKHLFGRKSTVTINTPKYLTRLGDFALSGITTDLVIPPTVTDFGVASLPEGGTIYCVKYSPADQYLLHRLNSDNVVYTDEIEGVEEIEEDGLTFWVKDGEATLVYVLSDEKPVLYVPESIHGYPVTRIASHVTKDNSDSALKKNKFSTIVIPGSVKRVDSYAFYEIMHTTRSVYLCEGVESVGDYAFRYDFQESQILTFPSSLKTIGEWEEAPKQATHSSMRIYAPAGSAAEKYAEFIMARFTNNHPEDGTIFGLYANLWFRVENGEATLYDGDWMGWAGKQDSIIPSYIDGYPVTGIDRFALKYLVINSDYTGYVVLPPTLKQLNYDIFSDQISKEYRLLLYYPGTPAEKLVQYQRYPYANIYDVLALPYQDVQQGDWYYSAVSFAYYNGLMNGVADMLFDPNGTMTRAMLVTVLWRLDGGSADGTSPYTDVPEGTWYTDGVIWATENGIVNGVGNGKFDPNGTVTREQIATILYRYAAYRGVDVSDRASLDLFTDAGAVSDYARAPMQWAVQTKLISGRLDHKQLYLAPQSGGTRAEVATILMRFLIN